MSYSRINPPITELIKSVTYNETRSAYSGIITFTHTAPDGYKLLVNKPIAAYASGNANSAISDRAASLSGTTLTVTMYIKNLESIGVTLSYTILYIKDV